MRAVRLVSILEATDCLRSHTAVINYTSVDPLLGTLEDLRMLATHLHQRDMYLLMDVPLAHAAGQHVSCLVGLSIFSLLHTNIFQAEHFSICL